ncbi:4'-phosphopantetheinyl transferase family protein [Protaetiibacter larvae]|uniref:4-phosphopantetheinyl transferase n=1 Tax=Protaetiibacter larvae TaxID=2592654 RepID=A0A5C1Y9I4_9MICO|nr:4-phosphopantetheinyl transferase [Protaetiibacter larvae]QEO10456.1 4-phosphopantetheinyl transferase [Protaetiibacter larvae]
MDPYVWAVDLDPAAAGESELALLSAVERRRFDESALTPGARFLAGRALLRRLAGEQLGLAPHEVPLAAVCPDCGGPHGRPVVEGSELRVSLAHSAVGVVAVAAWGRDIGVDIEPLAATARSSPAIREVAGGRGLAHWTRVEAVLKADGRGLRVDPRAVQIAPRGGRLEARIADRPTRYLLDEPDLAATLQVSVAIAR